MRRPLALIAALALLGAARAGCARTSREAARGDLADLDDFHRRLLQGRILRALGLHEIPPFNHSDTRRTPLTSDQDAASSPPPSYDLRVHPIATAGCSDSECSMEARFSGRLASRGGVRKPVVKEAVLVIPPSMWTSSRLHLRPSASLHDDFPAAVTDGWARVNVTAHLRPGAFFNLSLTIAMDDELSMASQPWLELKVEEDGGGGKEKRALDDSAIVDCESQWDQRHLNNTPARLQDSFLPCCRRKMRVSFEELGWSHWVVAPLGFDSWYCLGRCSGFGGFASAAPTEGPAFYADVMRTKAEGLGVSACCAPVAFAPLTLTVLVNPQEELTKTLTDVVATQCGCI